MKKLAITGLGVLHKQGENVSQFWSNLCAGEKLIPNHQEIFSLSAIKSEGFIAEDLIRRMSRIAQMLTLAVIQVISENNNFATLDRKNIGMCTSSNLGVQDSLLKFTNAIFLRGPRRANPMQFPNTVLNAISGYACIANSIKGYNNIIAGSGALAEALDALILKRAKSMLVSGVEEIIFNPLDDKALSILPFKQEKDLLVTLLGEGAGVLNLMPEYIAQELDKKIYAWCLDWAGTFGYEYISQSIEQALANNKLVNSEIDGIILANKYCLNIGQSLKQVFGMHLKEVPLFILPQVLGDLGGASEALGALCASLSLVNNQWPASPWFASQPELDEFNIAKSTREFEGKNILLLVADALGNNYAYIFSRA